AITGTTICQGLKISQATADDWLRQSVDKKYGPKVDKYSAYNWTQPEFDALVSFAYNIGSIDGLTAKGTRSRSEIVAKILEYNKAGGKVLAGLTRRRQEERKLFLTPVTIKTGWQQENGGWRFYKDDGSGEYVSDEWQQDGDKWYWFDGAGMMVHDVWYQYKGSWYYLGSDGAMLKGLQTISGKWYYLDQTGRMATEPVTLTPDQDGALQYPGLVK
ncbi:MAG: glycoside hydrolase family protein, partial [Enterocloster sp.]